jgi:hypothetical protein
MRAAERYNLLRCAMSFIWLVTALITEQNAVSRSTCQYHYAGRAPRGSARLTIGIFKRIREHYPIRAYSMAVECRQVRPKSAR